MPYKECPVCGAHLDHGEHCDCNAQGSQKLTNFWERGATEHIVNMCGKPHGSGKRELRRCDCEKEREQEKKKMSARDLGKNSSQTKQLNDVVIIP